jgi:tRNA-dihydrouridine synthase B
MIRIGHHRLSNRVALAPMAGVTDLPFRRLCSRFGAGYAVAEMVSADPRLRQSRKSSLRGRHDDEAEPRAVQIVGADPLQLAAAARYNVARGAQVIDINMGCPAKKVCRRAAGSALLADEQHVAELLRAVVGAVDVPVTLKIRTGVSPERRNGVTIARIAEDAGIAALAVHGRTRACAFRGEAEYDTLGAIVAATDFPVWANGDIDSPLKAEAVLAHSGAAGVMIGRAAQGRPWLCGQIAARLAGQPVPAAPSVAEQIATMDAHLRALHTFYGEFAGLRIARKHIGWYLAGAGLGDDLRRRFNALAAPGDQLAFLGEFDQPAGREALAA